MPALARASATCSPTVSPNVSAAAFKAAMRGPPGASTARINGCSGSTDDKRLRVCVVKKRKIGHRGNQTDTMRGIPLNLSAEIRSTLQDQWVLGTSTIEQNKNIATDCALPPLTSLTERKMAKSPNGLRDPKAAPTMEPCLICRVPRSARGASCLGSISSCPQLEQ